MAINSKHRVYIPTNAKSNQYILAEIKPDEAFYRHYQNPAECYQKLSQQFFALADEFGLHNVHMIANDKLPVVRYHHEAYCLQTEKQILFFYDPQYHEAQNLFTKPDYQARKIRLVFLATGTEIRAHAAEFHSKVSQLLESLKGLLPDPQLQVKIRDHQHLSYDLFASAKGQKETYGYKLRGLYPRYRARQCDMPENHSAISYVTVNLPLTRQLKQRYLKPGDTDFSPLYEALEKAFLQASEDKNLFRLALVANGLTPLVRNSQVDQSQHNTELQKISFDTAHDKHQFSRHWQADNLVETAHFIIVAGDEDNTESGYGHFMNRVEAALNNLAKTLQLDPMRNEMIVRFHQHISYMLS
ncbi:DUF3083 family protein [Lacimicrobium alkaliphilum]|uniref:DUF3083 domain-containing protein n=1 Tax=Lacimicrobium alkaliphilum TaxID=1526571 RepID=A0A0U3AH71_9ALTE|nr:DUF3083 family protein [Lacimicrobium alkaliphilum]ALS98049.1 hypothetical protein AT746_07085 [Lacimicrobium alkaliphilum]